VTEVREKLVLSYKEQPCCIDNSLHLAFAS